MTTLENVLAFGKIAATCVAFIGGLGGLWYIVDRIRNRPRIRIDGLAVRLAAKPSQSTVSFEAENVSESPNSISRRIEGWAFRPTGRSRLRRVRIYYGFDERVDRSLPPFEPRHFVAQRWGWDQQTESDAFLWYQIYRFVPRRGRTITICLRNANGTRISFKRLILEVLYQNVLGAPFRVE